MSAIAGFWSFSGERALDPCGRMLQGQQSYGLKPAVSGDSVAFGRLLHATLPEDQFDRQPLHRRPFRLVADVRLDNRADLAEALGFPAERVAVLADSDLLFECLLKWGEGAADRLVGEFAFGLWDEDQQSLLLGRDLFGHRPLHFHRGKDFFAFATMPSGLHALARIPREFDKQALADDLALLPLGGTRTLFRQIERVEPGHFMRVTRERGSSRSYWSSPRPDKRGRAKDFEEGLRDVVETAVKAQLRGPDTPVGSHLSAGLDSSIVTALAAQMTNPGKVLGFTAAPREGFDGPVPDGLIADETAYAAQTAALYPNIEHIVVNHSDESLLDVLDRQFSYMQQPTLGPCNSLWVRQINRTASARGAKVMLVGHAGNLTASYGGREAWSALLPQGRLLKLLGIGAGMMAKGLPIRTLAAQLFGPILPRSLWVAACRAYGRPTDLSGYSAIRPELRAAVEARAAERGIDLLYQPSNDPQGYREMALADGDNGNYFKGILGEFGISMRDPLSDRRVVEYCLAIPGEEFIRGGIERGLARRAFANDLPHSVSQLHQRGYQGADWYEALGRDLPSLAQEAEAIARCDLAGEVLDTGWVSETLAAQPNGGWANRDVVHRHRYGLLRAISAGHFMRKVSGTN